MIIDAADGFEPVVFRAVRPDGATVAAAVIPDIVHSQVPDADGRVDWQFVLSITNSPPRGGRTFWTISHVRIPTSG